MTELPGRRVWKLALKRPEKTVLRALADYGDERGGSICPGMRSVAHDTDYSERQVRRIIDDLVGRGYLKLEATDYGKYGTNLYSIQWDAIPLKKPLEPRGGQDKMSSPSNKEGADISHGDEDIQMSANRSVNRPRNFKEDEEARARTKKIDGPIPKAHSARKPAHPPPELPKEGAPTAGPPPQNRPAGLADGADIEALLADPVLLVAAGAWLSLQGRGLETLTAAECETLSRSRAAWGKRFSPDDIRLALDKTTLRKAQVPHVYFVGLLDEWAKQPANNHARARAAPNGHNGNGHAHVHGPEWNGVENGHIVDGAAYHAYHERLAEVRVVKSGGG